MDRPMKRRVNRNFLKEPALCEFNRVSLDIPRLKLIKLLFKKSYLDYDDVIFLKALLWKTEAANNKILHVQSIVEKTLLKAGSLHT